ncbi:MAG: YraN family protein [Rhizobiaceae bacterium]
MAVSKKLKAYRKGHCAETLAAIALTLKGYRVVAKRFKTPVGEVDLIARKKDLVVFVEVKARATEDAALNSISISAQKRISSAGEWWLSQQNDASSLSWRFDVMAVLPWQWPRHFEDVW